MCGFRRLSWLFKITPTWRALTPPHVTSSFPFSLTSLDPSSQPQPTSPHLHIYQTRRREHRHLLTTTAYKISESSPPQLLTATGSISSRERLQRGEGRIDATQPRLMGNPPTHPRDTRDSGAAGGART